jgi:hypothetical protein
MKITQLQPTRVHISNLQRNDFAKIVNIKIFYSVCSTENFPFLAIALSGNHVSGVTYKTHCILVYIVSS